MLESDGAMTQAPIRSATLPQRAAGVCFSSQTMKPGFFVMIDRRRVTSPAGL